MTPSAPLGYRCVIRIRHSGCWASQLSSYLHEKRPDLELVVFARSVSQEPFSYNVVAVIKSEENKEIGDDFDVAIETFLLQFPLIRVVKRRIPRPSESVLILLIKVFDEDAPAAIRTVLKYGGTIHTHIGMPVINGVEHVTFFAVRGPLVAAQAQAEYSNYPAVYRVEGVDIGGKMFTGEEELFDDPFYLPTYILCSEEKRRGFISALRTGLQATTEWIIENASWLIPLLAFILRWLYAGESLSTPFPPSFV